MQESSRPLRRFPAAAVILLSLVLPPCLAEGEIEVSARIDAHVHIFNRSPDIRRLLERLNIRAVNICVVDRYERGYEEASPQHAVARGIVEVSSGRIPWVATFDPQGWDSPGFADRIEQELGEAFREGAVGVKVYKSIGMELKKATGEYVMPDDPVFRAILRFIADQNKTLYAHLAEPIAAWQPLDPSSPDYSYYRDVPAWHMYGHPGRPTKQQILEARDRMLEQNPELRVIGAHLGSMEEDVDQIAGRLDRYPNFAVDTAARVTHLMLQPTEKVREFLMAYQDRVLYGTDLVIMEWDAPASSAQSWEAVYARDLRYFATDETVKYPGGETRGLDLPPDVLRKLFHDNAVRWIPGLAP